MRYRSATRGGGPHRLSVLFKKTLSDAPAHPGASLHKGLKSISSRMIVDVRGKGLLIGLETDPRRASARQFVETLLKHGVLSKDTHGTVARFAPALIIEREQVDWGVARIRDALREFGPVYEKAA